MELIFLGTGNAGVTKRYNTCFLLRDPERVSDPYFLVDAGGGNGILRQLKKADVDPRDIRTLFVTHRHLDHILGVFWILRTICQTLKKENYPGTLTIYANDEVTWILRDMSRRLLETDDIPGFSGHVSFEAVGDGEKRKILGREVTFFDIRSTKAKQSGFCMLMENGKKLTYCGDEPCQKDTEPYAEGADLLIHEAFCLYEDREKFDPYEKHHSTVRDAAMLAERLGVKNLILVHTEEKTGKERKKRYRKEGEQYFSGKLLVPEDLEEVDLPGSLGSEPKTVPKRRCRTGGGAKSTLSHRL